MSKLNSKSWKLPKHEVHEFKKKKHDYCICIPVIDEGKKIQKQLKKLKKYTKQVDVIIADGDSTDGSLEHKFVRSVGVRTILVKKGEGRQATQLRMVFAYALKQGYKGIIQMDGNNKDGVDAIPNFVKELENGYDYLQGSRFVKGGEEKNTPASRKWGIILLLAPLLSVFSGYKYTDVTNGFRGYSKKYLLHPEVKPFREIFVSYSLNFYLTVRANQLSLKTKELPVSRKYPKGEFPTKMKGWRGPLKLVEEVFKAAFGFYHPKNVAE